jgi:hypothetical protein
MQLNKIIMIIAALGIVSGPAQAIPVVGGVVDTDRFGYSGTITRYASLQDARDNVNSTDTVTVSDRDVSLQIAQNDSLYSDVNYVAGSWFYTIDEQGRAGWGNTTGNTGVGYMQLYDVNGITDTALSMAFNGFDGTYYTQFDLNLVGENLDPYSRLSAYDNVNDGGIWHNYALNMTATGLQGQQTGWNVIEAFNLPTSGYRGLQRYL